MNKIIIGSLLLIVIIVVLYLFSKKEKQDIESEEIEMTPKMTFSNTQKWYTPYLNIANRITPRQLEIIEKYNMKNMNYPSDIKTEEELEELLIKQDERTEQDIENINYELKLKNVISRFTDNKIIHKKLTDLINEYMSVVYYLKRHYDRVRPSYLNTDIKPSVIVPLHASYPSGHASQAYFIANYMSYVNPSKRDFYQDIANKTATNREIAGVHYKSDSTFGKFIADKYFKEIMADGRITNEPSESTFN